MEFQNSWFFHTRTYFDPSVTVKGLSSEKVRELYDLWQAITFEAVQSDCEIAENEQRIFLVSLASIVYDMKSEEVMVGKKNISVSTTSAADKSGQTLPSLSIEHHRLDSHQFAESTISLFHYAGYALHSMIQTTEKRIQTGKLENGAIRISTELTILKDLQCDCEDMNDVPEPIKELRVSNLCIVSPSLIPFVQSLVKNVLLVVNEEQLKSKGEHMIADAKKVILHKRFRIMCENDFA